MDRPLRIQSVDHLKEVLAQGQKDYFMLLAGAVKSRKTIRYDQDSDTFSVINHIDGSEEKMSGRAFRRSLMAEAIQRGAFFAEKCATCWHGTRNCYEHGKIAE